MDDKKAIDYLTGKYPENRIEFVKVEKEYSKQYGWEYVVHFKKNGVYHKDTLSQFAGDTL